jgi:diguanylate cyclase (GGDEF)-like protein
MASTAVEVAGEVGLIGAVGRDFGAGNGVDRGRSLGAFRRFWLGAAGRDPWHETVAAQSLRRSLLLVAVGTVVALLAGIAGLVVTLDIVIPSVVPAGHVPAGITVVRVLLVLDGVVCVLVIALLVRERGRLAVLGTLLRAERERAEASKTGVALQAEHMSVVLGVGERLAGSVSMEDISAVVVGAACAITGAPAASLLLMNDTGTLVPATGDVLDEPVRPAEEPQANTLGWSVSLIASGEVVGVLELAGIRRPPPAVATVVEALAAHAAGAVEVTRRYAKLRQASFTDPLTGVPNRGALDLALQSECERALRANDELAVVMIDIDHFKRYNDTYGHQEGDAALRSVARVLAKALRRRGDGVYRYGGEEFVIVLPGTDGSSGVAVAERMRAAVGEACDAGALTNPVSASFGVAATSLRLHGPSELLRAADAALYRAKQAGRDRVVLWPDEADPRGDLVPSR